MTAFPEKVAPQQARAAPIRVLMLGPALEVRGGISAVERALIEALPPHVSVRHVATMREGSKAAKLGAFLRSLGAAWQETRRDARPDVVHIHFASRASSVRKMALARLAMARGCAVVMHAHGGEYRDYWNAAPSFQKRHIVETLNRARALIVLGESWREFFARIGVAGERIAVLPNPVTLPAALPLRMGAMPVTFVYLGLVSEAKGAFDLVRALAQLAPQSRSRLRLVIAGNGELEALHRKIRQSGLEETIGVRPWLGEAERDALLASAEAFVLPSQREGLPMALLEAMAWGLAPVATPVGAIPEIVAHEQNGLLVPPGDIAGLARAMERLLDAQLRARLGGAARRRVEPLAVERYAERLSQLYEAIACNRLH